MRPRIGRLLAFVAHRRLEPGDRPPSERELAERRPNSGIHLREAGRQGSLDSVVLRAELGVPFTEAEVTEAVELRGILELRAVRLACDRRRTAVQWTKNSSSHPK